jgi:ATP-dependent exoDNAse (exonuclease V) beta subunit
LAEIVGLGSEDFRERRFAVAQHLRERLATLGFGPFCATLLPAVRAGYGAWDEKRFEQLIDLAYAFDPRAGLRADRFVDHVRGTKVEDPSATQIQVMTIHAAKGLEFDCVILPELNEPFTTGEQGMLTRRMYPAQRMDAVSVPASSAVRDLDPDGLGALHAHHEERLMRESLCVLYVAMTRAKHRLEMIVRAESTRRHGSYAKILCHALAGGAVAQAGGVLWSHPESAKVGLPAPKAAQATSPAAAPELLWAAHPAPRLPRRTPSGEEDLLPRSAADLLRSPTSRARTRGILFHRWLEQIEWLDSFDASDAELIALATRLTTDADLIRSALEGFRSKLEAPALRALLTRPGPSGEILVWRERPFCVPLDGELWSGAFDRVVLEREQGAFVRADVIDFKTDRVEGAQLEQRLEHYRPQIEAYRRVLAHATGLALDAVRARMFFLEAGVER